MLVILNSDMGKANQLASKSPAEFFSENQNIAGFDNAGKSLYTTIREFVENSLDAAEACHALPEVRYITGSPSCSHTVFHSFLLWRTKLKTKTATQNPICFPLFGIFL